MVRINTCLASLFLLAVAPAVAAAQERGDDLTVRLSMEFPNDVQMEAVRPGQRTALYLETSEPAYVALFELTPQFEVLLRHPIDPKQPYRFDEDEPRRIGAEPFEPLVWRAPRLRSRSEAFGHLIAVASPTPLDIPAALSAVGLAGRWNRIQYSARSRALDPDVVIDTMLEALGGDAVSASVLSYVVTPHITIR